MAEVKKGRPSLDDPRKLVSVYLTSKERKAIEKKYGSLSIAVRKLVLPKCG